MKKTFTFYIVLTFTYLLHFSAPVISATPNEPLAPNDYFQLIGNIKKQGNNIVFSPPLRTQGWSAVFYANSIRYKDIIPDNLIDEIVIPFSEFLKGELFSQFGQMLLFTRGKDKQGNMLMNVYYTYADIGFKTRIAITDKGFRIISEHEIDKEEWLACSEIMYKHDKITAPEFPVNMSLAGNKVDDLKKYKELREKEYLEKIKENFQRKPYMIPNWVAILFLILIIGVIVIGVIYLRKWLKARRAAKQ